MSDSAVAALDAGGGGPEPAQRPARPRRALAWMGRHPTVAAALIYALLSVLMVGQGLLPGRTLSGSDTLLAQVPWQQAQAGAGGLGANFELADAAVVFGPFLRYSAAHLPSVPLWNPHIMGGRPFVGDGQSAVFSPFSVPSYLLPFWKSLAVVAMLKLFLAALGTFVLARMLGMRFAGALLSGLVFAFGTFFVVWLAWPLTSIFALIPWTLIVTERLVRRPGPLPVCALAVLLALGFLGGHPESTFHLLFVTVVFFIFRALRMRRPRRGALRDLREPVLGFAAAVALGAGLAAIALLPFAELLLHSADLARRGHATPTFWPRRFLGALFLHDYWGRPTQVDLQAFMVTRGWYAGAMTLMLAAAALLLRRTAERVAVAVFALFCACMVIGIPPVFGLVTALPGFRTAYNQRLLIYFLLCVALLAGWGLDDLVGGRVPGRLGRRAVLSSAAALFCVPVVWMLAAGTLSLHSLGRGLDVAWGFAHPPTPAPGSDPQNSPAAPIVRDSALLIWLPLAGAGLGLLAWRQRRRRPLSPIVFATAAVVLIAVDLFRANMGYNPAIPVRKAEPPVTGAIRFLWAQRPARFVGVSTALFTQPLPVDLAMDFGLYDARGYDYPVEKRFDGLWRGYVAPGVGDFTQPEEFASATPAAVRALSLLSVSDLMTGPRDPAPTAPGLQVAYRGPDAILYSNPAALPRAFVVDHQQTVAGAGAALAAVTAPGFQGRGTAITEQPLPGVAQGAGVAPAGGSARLTGYAGERVSIDATAPDRGLLVLTDVYFPGWKATVDGRPATVQRVDYLLRGVELAPGRHTVVLRYEPASWRAGWIVSLLSLIAVLTATALGWRARRTGPAAA